MSIRITPYKISRIDSYEIKRGLNRHDEAMIQGEMSAEEYLVYEEMADSSTVLSLFYKDEKNKETLLFAGVLKTLKDVSLPKAAKGLLMKKFRKYPGNRRFRLQSILIFE